MKEKNTIKKQRLSVFERMIMIGVFFVQFSLASYAMIAPLIMIPARFLGGLPLVSLILLSYFVYLGILIRLQRKKKIGPGQFLSLLFRWFLIGPFAYRKLIRTIRAQKEIPLPPAPLVLDEQPIPEPLCEWIDDGQDEKHRI